MTGTTMSTLDYVFIGWGLADLAILVLFSLPLLRRVVSPSAGKRRGRGVAI